MARRLTFALLAFAFWTLLGVVFAAQTYLSAAVLSQPISWKHAFAYAVPGWYVWALLAPLVTLLGRQVRIERGRRLFGALFHLTAAALLSLLHTAVAVGLMFLTMPDQFGSSYIDALRLHVKLGAHLDLLTYAFILVVSYAIQAQRLAAGLAQARLDALRMELNPHFLFNTLNTVSSLIYDNPRAADQMIARLGDMLRTTLQSRERNEISLADEIEFAQSYVAIEEVRFDGRLRVQFDIDREAANAQVPNLVLQPLVENAIRHGIVDSAGGVVTIVARRERDTLTLRVTNSGKRWSANGNGAGIGLTNTRARLEAMYGADHSFHIGDGDDGGAVVIITIPYKSEAT